MQGIFIQMASLPQDPYLDNLIHHVALRHPEITELVFSDASMHHQQRLFMNPLLNGSRFKKFVGITNVPWTPDIRFDQPVMQDWMKPIAGVGGMMTPTYRWEQIGNEHSHAISWLTYKGQDWHWYIGQEVGLDAIGDHPNLKNVWEWYLTEICIRLHKLAPSRDILWSPYIWEAWGPMSESRRNRTVRITRDMLAIVKRASNTAGVTMLDLQDGRGAQPLEPETDAVNWYKLMIMNGTPAKLRINMEYFKYDETYGYMPQTLEEMDRRTKYYADNAVPIGNCWETRYWMVPMYYNHPH